MLYTVYSAYYALLCKHMLVLKSKKSAPLQYVFIYLWRWLYKGSGVHMGGGGSLEAAEWRGERRWDWLQFQYHLNLCQSGENVRCYICSK